MATTSNTSRMPVAFISHGGGPSFFIESPPGSPMHDISKGSESFKALQGFSKLLKEKPTAIVVVSGHWEGAQVLVGGKDQYTKLYFDYGGFPDFTYKLQYPAPAHPQLAQQIVQRLSNNKIDAVLDKSRDWDHGVFVPLMVMFPDADIPVVEVSILQSYDPAAHIAIGKALAPLRDQGVLILGSGFATHTFGSPAAKNAEFIDHVNRVVENYSPEEREKAFLEWTKFPSARAAHAQEDHFVPMHVVVGASGQDKGKVLFRAPVMNGRGIFCNWGFGM